MEIKKRRPYYSSLSQSSFDDTNIGMLGHYWYTGHFGVVEVHQWFDKRTQVGKLTMYMSLGGYLYHADIEKNYWCSSRSIMIFCNKFFNEIKKQQTNI